ncbi:hypothetical protein BH11CYA1_BH11CYA1_20660 [soil metagenome]
MTGPETTTTQTSERKPSSIAILWHKAQRYCMIGIFSAIATGVYLTPLQKYITMGRYQHYGITISIFGLGYLLQTIWSWRNFTKWARISYLSTGLFFSTVGMTFYTNPWLDSRMSMQTAEKEFWKNIFIAVYVLITIAIVSIWLKWIKEEKGA